MDLEQRLRSVLTDERLDVPLTPGAVRAVHEGVRRRKRRNAALSAAASFALVAGGIASGVVLTQGGGATLSPGPDQQGASQTPPPVGQGKAKAHAADEIPWAPLGYDVTKSFALPGTSPQPGVPWCKSGQLSLTASEFQGATGSAAGALVLTNNGGTCGLQGEPTLTGYGTGDKIVARSATGDAFVVHPWFALKSGQQARSDVQIFGDGSRCLGPVERMSVDLGRGGAPLSTDVAWVGGGGVQPRCGTADASRQLDHYVASAGAWTRRDGTPRLPMSDFSADIGEQPTTVMQGATVRYQVLLSTGGAKVRPCLPYREQLVALDGTQTAYGTSYFRMNCSAMGAPSAQGYTLDMELALPNDIPVGSYALQWQTPIQSLGSGGSQTIQITPAPAPCQQDQLDFSVGGSGAATGHYALKIILRNISPRACSLRGFPGVQFVNADGADMPTVPHHGSSFMWNTSTYETVRLAAGTAASFALGGVDMDSTGQQCPVATTVKVIAPGLFKQVPLQVNWPYCLQGHVDVSPVVAGVDGPA
ncbi:MAG TPA: DUF4232 domain-containing protein [Mycobacteriales bacterium]|nr:DUF4232 domain-containing protein [Mycobacteriales bacterium]